ncbi:MAG: 2Fe-2S iron-sulfur cluster-binding protein [Parasphingopyxis sp.]|uniref:2Fe-2S iron-sulfur cluster-binding protein n=1 Tax=Parasphingopyxis sp. TaxID=1920299 RepID=UPI003F9FF1AC
MVRVVFYTGEGTRIETDEPAGSSAMRAAINAGVPGIDADCGGACSCATCHVHVAPDWIAVVGPAGETEADMIEFDAEVTPVSRLACQIELSDALDGLELHVARQG